MKLSKSLHRIILGFSLFFIASVANATIISFDGLSGSNGDAYTGHTESGFTVTSVLGAWREAHLFGAPIPDIFSSSASAAVEVTLTSGGMFQFNSVDLGLAGGSGLGFSIEGFSDGASVFTTGGLFGSVVEFNTIASTSSDMIDMLRITMIKNSASSYNIDNINLSTTSVPEPTTALLLGVGLIGLSGAIRKKARA